MPSRETPTGALGPDQGLDAHSLRHLPKLVRHPAFHESHHVASVPEGGHGFTEKPPIRPTPDRALVLHEIFHHSQVFLVPEESQDSPVQEATTKMLPRIPHKATGQSLNAI
jgi:hypothetical protein